MTHKLAYSTLSDLREVTPTDHDPKAWSNYPELGRDANSHRKLLEPKLARLPRFGWTKAPDVIYAYYAISAAQAQMLTLGHIQKLVTPLEVSMFPDFAKQGGDVLVQVEVGTGQSIMRVGKPEDCAFRLAPGARLRFKGRGLHNLYGETVIVYRAQTITGG